MNFDYRFNQYTSNFCDSKDYLRRETSCEMNPFFSRVWLNIFYYVRIHRHYLIIEVHSKLKEIRGGSLETRWLNKFTKFKILYITQKKDVNTMYPW